MAVSAIQLSREEIIRRVRAGVMAIRGEVMAIVIFGSFARGQSYQDVDVLVVVREPAKPLLEQGPEMSAIQQAVALPLDVDVLIYSEEELRRGLASRLPLLLDVAFDGLVIHGQESLTPLLARTRRDVLARGIRRTEAGGWRYPVRYRQNTPLSPVGNADWARKWLEDAERDLAASEVLFGVRLYDRCITHCQQVTEKSAKAVLACFGRLERTHFVAAVLRTELEQQHLQDGEQHDALEKLASGAQMLEPAAIWSRHPREDADGITLPAERYDSTTAEKGLTVAQRSFSTARTFIEWWFTPTEANDRGGSRGEDSP
jgi:HEPN domain-containing protein/predicted nucleotidyltransferase